MGRPHFMRPYEIVSGAWLAAVVTLGEAAPPPDLLQFAQRYANKYPSEVKDQSAFDREYVVRTKIGEAYSTEMSYDDAAGVATVLVGSVDSELRMNALVDTCTPTGRGTGVTGFGVRVNFVKQTCNRVFLRGYDELRLGAESVSESYVTRAKFTIPMTPTEFRRLKALNYIEMTVALTPTIPKGVVVEKDTVYEAAKSTYPYETTMHVHYIEGTVRELRYYLPWSKTPFLAQNVPAR